MNVHDLQRDWDAFGKIDPLWAIFTKPGKENKKWDVADFFETGLKEIDALIAYIDSLHIPAQRRKVLDFGCGVGRLSQALARYFDHVDGIDVAPSMIERARQFNRFGEKVRYHVNGTASLKIFSDNTFDLIYSNVTLQHIPPLEVKAYLREFVRILAPGGLLIFQLPGTPVNGVSFLKAHTKRVAASSLLWLFRHIGYITRPIMVMHGIERQKVENLLAACCGSIVDVREDQSAGEDWLSYRYCVTKDKDR